MIGDKRVLAITLAKGKSIGLPRKNMVNLCGKPLLGYTIDEAKKSKIIDRYVISTEDKEITNYCKGNKAEVIKRPEYLATNTATSAEVLIYTIEQLEEKYDYVVELMATNPLKTAEQIDLCTLKLHRKKVDSVVTVVRLEDHHPARIKYMDDNDLLLPFFPEKPESRRQSLEPKAYIRNGSIYAMTREQILNSRARVGPRTIGYIVDSKESVNIDSWIDLKVAEIILNERISRNLEK